MENIVALLAKTEVTVNERVLGALVKDPGFVNQAKMCTTPEDASTLYIRVGSALSTKAKKQIVTKVHHSSTAIVAIDGRIEVSPLFSVSMMWNSLFIDCVFYSSRILRSFTEHLFK